jgi:predicted nuclease of restriction endonuclease-like (RecB) superfamily
MDISVYQSLLGNIQVRIRNAQIRVSLSANAEMIMLYWDIGKLIHQQQKEQGWGATVTSRLANDIKNELPEIKGFSERNLQFMVQFYKEYDFESVIAKQPVSQLQDSIILKVEFMKQPVSQIPWGHNILLIQKVKEKKTRLWYVDQTIVNG